MLCVFYVYYLQHLDEYLKTVDPQLTQSAPSAKPVRFEEDSVVVLELPNETPGFKITPDQDPPEVHVLAAALHQVTRPQLRM